MTQPLVSIIIPCYNAANFVGEAIESALQQTYAHKEVIVVDDGSTDSSVDVLQSFGDRIRWESGSNRGACAARNRGIELAKGTFIQFLDADDCLKPEKLDIQVPLALTTPGTLVFCEYDRSHPNDHSLPVREKLGGDTNDSVIFVINRPQIQVSSPLHGRTQLLTIGGFRNELSCCQDHDLHLRLACEGVKFKRLEMSLFDHRRRENSLSSNYTHVLRQWPDVYWHSYRLLEASGKLTDRRAAAFAGRMASDARTLLRIGLVAEAQRNFEDARQMHSSGGLPDAYDGLSRLMQRTFGPILTERLVQVKRSVVNR